MVTNSERRDSGMLYIADGAVMQEQAAARRLTQKLNTMDRADFEGLKAVVRQLLGRSDGAVINPPFYCDYGKNIEVGKNFFANYNCTLLDVRRILIGDNCQLAPNVAIYTAGHPIHPASRNTLFEYGAEVVIGSNVWIGGNTVVCPGVHIGDNTVIGAGSVVTKDVPDWTVSAGNPCRVIREITEEDRWVYFRGQRADEEAAREMQRLWREEPDGIRFPTKTEPQG
ncbi:MAG: sugar O-acetyltransferase [Fretibacterium sp.]|nr:sugar O-acetyltransferase [Fretibacterium sp.]